MVDGERQNEPFDYRSRCIDDHEQRLRHLEANNKEQAKLFVVAEKLEGQIEALDAKDDTRFRSIEKWVDAQIVIAATAAATKVERGTEKRDWKSDLFGLAALCVSIVLLILRALGK